MKKYRPKKNHGKKAAREPKATSPGERDGEEMAPTPDGARGSGDEDNPYVHLGRGRDKMSGLDFTGAIKDFSRAVELDPFCTEAYLQRAMSRYRLGDAKGALRDYNSVLRFDDIPVEHRLYRGLVKQTLGDSAGALKEYDEAIRTKPDYALAYYIRGMHKHSTEGFLGAIEDLVRAIEIDSHDDNLNSLRALLGAQLGDDAGKLRELDETLKMLSENARSNPLAGSLTEGFSGAKLPEGGFSEVIELGDNIEDDILCGGRMDIGDGAESLAMSDLGGAISENPQSGEAYYLRGTAKLRSGDLEGAIKDFDSSIEQDPRKHAPFCARGSVKNLLGDTKGAMADYEHAISLEPNEPHAYLNLASLKSGLGDEKGAKKYHDIAEKLLEDTKDT